MKPHNWRRAGTGVLSVLTLAFAGGCVAPKSEERVAELQFDAMTRLAQSYAMDLSAMRALALSLLDIQTQTARAGVEDASPLTEEERALVSSALTQLAASQAIIAGQNRLLQLHGELRSRIDSITQSALGALRSHLQEPSPLDEFDFGAAETARRQLLDEIESANTKRAALAAVFKFVRTFGDLSG